MITYIYIYNDTNNSFGCQAVADHPEEARQRGAARRWRCHGTCKLALFASFDGKNMGKSWENPLNPLWMDENHWENHWLVVKHGWENSWSKWRFLVKSTDYERFSSHVWWAAQIPKPQARFQGAYGACLYQVLKCEAQFTQPKQSEMLCQRGNFLDFLPKLIRYG